VQSALDSACQALIDAANAKGGHDNITVLLVACP
jgi:serine/threonine protein phosphatase PrpC